MKLSKILLVRKKSTYEIQALEHQESNFLSLIKQNHESIKVVLKAHEEHSSSLENIKLVLNQKNINFDLVDRSSINQNISGYDLVISVGGDGTLLDASHYIHNSIPILGVNSSISSSFGHFCLADSANFKSVLENIEDDKISPINILRLELFINGVSKTDVILNEVLIAHPNPAATSRYLISASNDFEEQRSSGVLVTTPAGSTGTYRACGGGVLPIDCNNYAYLVREPGLRPKEVWHNTGSSLDKRQKVTIISKMRQAMAYVDGPHLNYPFNLGDEIIIQPSSKPLCAFIDNKVNEQFN